MTLRTKILALAGAVALTLTIAVTAIAAGGPLSTLAAPGGAGTAGQDQTDFLSKLAANLGIGQDTLTAAIKTTDLQQIDAAVAAGQMTADEANAARDRVNNSPNGIPPFGIGGGRGGQGGGAGDQGRGHGDQAALMDAGATYFGISADQLRQDLMDTGSWQGVAAKYGKDNDAGKAGLEAALESALRQSLTTRGLDATQIDQQVNQFKQNFDQFYTQKFGQRGLGGPQGPAPSASPAP